MADQQPIQDGGDSDAPSGGIPLVAVSLKDSKQILRLDLVFRFRRNERRD